MAFEHVVRFSEVDGAGILFFSRAFELAHAAYEAWLADRGLPIADLLEHDWLFPLVHADADFHAPCRLGDALRVEVSVERTSRSSMTMRFDIGGADGVARATVRHVHVAVDRESFAARPLPDALKAL